MSAVALMIVFGLIVLVIAFKLIDKLEAKEKKEMGIATDEHPYVEEPKVEVPVEEPKVEVVVEETKAVQPKEVPAPKKKPAAKKKPAPTPVEPPKKRKYTKKADKK